MSEFALREARPGDIEGLLALWRATQSGPSVTDTPDHLAMVIEEAGDLFLVAESDGRLAGSVLGGWDLWRGQISRLAVHPDFQRQGIARALLQAVEGRLRQRGARRVHAIAFNREAAIGFWSASGYARSDAVVFLRTLHE
ncbi:MAG: GNAT family N-acetyltransferase [Dehalococcoidia bacterium]|nr:GNAT family N-acetyltransferase [Dehalococcoidia bacterium]